LSVREQDMSNDDVTMIASQPIALVWRRDRFISAPSNVRVERAARGRCSAPQA
jgi:hypothetical protein